MLKGAEVKKLLKKEGINTKYVRVSTRTGSYKIELTDWSVSEKEVLKIMRRHGLEKYTVCEATGDILLGGNTFVFVNYDWKLEPSLEIQVTVAAIRNTYANPEEARYHIINDCVNQGIPRVAVERALRMIK